MVESVAGLAIETALSLVASGQDAATFMAKKPRTLVHEARRAVSTGAVESYLARLIADRAELEVTLGSRTVVDVLTEDGRTEFRFARLGLVKKMDVIAFQPRSATPKVAAARTDPALAASPTPVPELPEARPASDPRPFMPHVGRVIEIELRNGDTFRFPLVAVGSFDLLLGGPGNELFVPLHALVRWQPAHPI